MSSLLNKTTGECISGPCKSIELLQGISPWVWIEILVSGILLIILSILITRFVKHSQILNKTNGEENA